MVNVPMGTNAQEMNNKKIRRATLLRKDEVSNFIWLLEVRGQAYK